MALNKHILEILAEHENYNLVSIRKTLNSIISANADVLQALHDGKVKISEGEVYIESLSEKIIFASKTIYEITKGTTLESLNTDQKITIIDVPSIYVLTRSIIEAFLTLEYLYFNKEPANTKQFRYRLWKFSGLYSRQRFKMPNSPELNKKKKSEKEIMDSLLEEIKADPLFSDIKEKHLYKIDRYGLPRLFSWRELIELSSIKTKFLDDIYSLYSNYAHSEYLSAIQINELSFDARNKQTIENARLCIILTRIIDSTIIIFLKERFKSCEIIYNSLPQKLITTIDYLYEFGRK